MTKLNPDMQHDARKLHAYVCHQYERADVMSLAIVASGVATLLTLKQGREQTAQDLRDLAAAIEAGLDFSPETLN